MNIEEAKANIGKEVVLLPETKPYFGAVKYRDFDYESLERKDQLIIGDTTISGLVVINGRAIHPQHIKLKEGEEMKEFKIKVANKVESKEVQDLLFELGYKWETKGKGISYLDMPALTAWSDGTIAYIDHNCTFGDCDRQEITLPQLRDLVILHRNDVSDATHDGENGKKWLVLGKGEKYDFYFWHKESNKWISNPLNTNNRPKMTLIKPQMTWQDALRAMADGKEVEMEWADGWYKAETVRVNNIKKGESFRLAPQRKELNGNFTKEELLKIAGEMV